MGAEPSRARVLAPCAAMRGRRKPPRPIEERFWEKVDRLGPDDCWEWTGGRYQHGYGMLYANGRNRRATQISWEIANGKPFPLGKVACHACDNPPCVNPAHIWPGTMRENTLDCIAKGRKPKPRYTYRPRSHCVHGHELTDSNTYVDPRGFKTCRTCRKAAGKARIHDRDKKNDLQQKYRARLRNALSTKEAGDE